MSDEPRRLTAEERIAKAEADLDAARQRLRKERGLAPSHDDAFRWSREFQESWRSGFQRGLDFARTERWYEHVQHEESARRAQAHTARLARIDAVAQRARDDEHSAIVLRLRELAPIVRVDRRALAVREPIDEPPPWHVSEYAEPRPGRAELAIDSDDFDFERWRESRSPSLVASISGTLGASTIRRRIDQSIDRDRASRSKFHAARATYNERRKIEIAARYKVAAAIEVTAAYIEELKRQAIERGEAIDRRRIGAVVSAMEAGPT